MTTSYKTFNKLSFYSQAYLAKNCKVLRFLEQSKEKASSPKNKLIGNKVKLKIPDKVLNDFFNNIQTILKSQSVLNFDYNANQYLELYPISTDLDEGYIDLLYEETDITKFDTSNNNENLIKYFKFDNVTLGQLFESIDVNSSILYDNKSNTLNINNYKLLKSRDNLSSGINNINNTNTYNLINKKINPTKIGIIAEGSFIAPIFQIINSIYYVPNILGNFTSLLRNKALIKILKRSYAYNSKKPAVSLVYYNNIAEEMCFAEDLFNYYVNSKIHFYPMLKFPSNKFKFGEGNINTETIYNNMPDYRDINSVVLVSGSEEFYNNSVYPLLDNLGYNEGINLFYYNHNQINYKI